MGMVNIHNRQKWITIIVSLDPYSITGKGHLVLRILQETKGVQA